MKLGTSPPPCTFCHCNHNLKVMPLIKVCGCPCHWNDDNLSPAMVDACLHYWRTDFESAIAATAPGFSSTRDAR